MWFIFTTYFNKQAMETMEVINIGMELSLKTNPKQNIKAVKLNFPILPIEF